MDKQQALELLTSHGYSCSQNQPSSFIGVSARKTRPQYSSPTAMTAEEIMADPAYQADVQKRLVEAGVFKKGGKKRSCKKRGGNKRSCKKRGGNKRSCKKRN